MSAPYFCTKCGHQHVRGKVYEEHKDFSKEIAAKIDEIVEGERKALAFELQPEIDAAALPADIIPLPKLTAIVAGEVVNTPAYREPRLKPDAPDVLWDDRTAEYESRMEFHKHNEQGLPDRVIESLQAPEMGKVVRGQEVKKPWYRRLFKR